MPNGYTAGIYDGEQSLRDFLMGVGRGMGFAVMQRDDPMDEPVKRQPESTYYTRSLVTAREDLARLEALTPETARPLAEAAYSEAMDRYRETKRDKLALRARYDDMERQVLAWDPPAEIQVVKDAALKYLRQSADFDCGERGEEMRFYSEPRWLSPEDWLREEVAAARERVARYEREAAAERKRTDERNRYIDLFLSSLPVDASVRSVR